MKTFLLISLLILSGMSSAQVNITVTNAVADNILKGTYNPADYAATTVIDDKASIVQGINAQVNSDSLKAYIIKMGEFGNRNTGADTVSTTTGIGAARRWAFDKFSQFSAANDSRLQVSYLQFDQAICAMNKHRNIFGVLPGTNATNHEVIIIEGHLDSRCDTPCDIACLAEGIEDNATGSALVLELARVMSQYTYENTIVFMLTIGEEQGLYGANAFSQYALDNSLPIKAVFNNDVVGGIICGETSSAPSCPGLNDIDSTAVRFFSQGSNSHHKQLARYTKLQYKEELLATVSVPMMIHIMSAEDRSGRGGDHIPFRQDGFTAMRTTSANEHGDASNDVGYTDRQHTSEDILGIDTDNDLIIDSFFVDFNYLGRNSVINGTSAAMVAIGPRMPTATFVSPDDSSLTVTIVSETGYPAYRVAIRTTTNDWDTVYTMTSLSENFVLDSANIYFVSVASVDDSGVESLFGLEQTIFNAWLETDEVQAEQKGLHLLQNRPNPFDEATIISVHVDEQSMAKKAHIEIRDIRGVIIEKLPIELSLGLNDVIYEHGFGKTGTFSYSLVVDGVVVDTKRMIFAN